MPEYTFIPCNKNSIYATEYWENELSDGKSVTILHVQLWRSGIFSAELTEKEKDAMLAQDVVVLNHYSCCIDELYSGEFVKYEIVDSCKYSAENMIEIRNLMFCEEEEEECEEEFEEEFDQYIMESNGWSINDTIYEVVGGMELDHE